MRNFLALFFFFFFFFFFFLFCFVLFCLQNNRKHRLQLFMELLNDQLEQLKTQKMLHGCLLLHDININTLRLRGLNMNPDKSRLSTDSTFGSDVKSTLSDNSSTYVVIQCKRTFS